MQSGIYKIYNIKSKRYYIGQSIDVAHRIKTHKKELKKNIHVNKDLQQDFNNYGEEFFIFEKIHSCEVEFLNAMEQYFMEKYNTLRGGYNIRAITNVVREGTRFDVKKESAEESFEELTFLDLEISKKENIALKILFQVQSILEGYNKDEDIEIEELEQLWTELYSKYISPKENKYGKYIIDNLIKKYGNFFKFITSESSEFLPFMDINKEGYLICDVQYTKIKDESNNIFKKTFILNIKEKENE